MSKKLSLFILLVFVISLGFFAERVMTSAIKEEVDAVVYSDQRESVRASVFWLVNNFQNDDGGYASLSTGANQAPSSISGTLDAVLAIGGAGYTPSAVFPGQESTPLEFLEENANALMDFAMDNGGQAGKVVLALTASAVDPRNFGGQDFVAVLTNSLEPSGAYQVNDPFKQALAMLGVTSVRLAVPDAAIAWLEDKQTSNGSWDDGFGTTDNPDTTAMAVMALVAAGQPPEASSVQLALQFLADSQQVGGWGYAAGLTPSANSTALVIQALVATGEPWYSDTGGWSVGGRSPLQALLDFQSVSGAFQSDFGQGPFDDFYATVQAIPAVSGRAFPLPARHEAALAGLSCLEGMQDATSGGWPAFAGGPIDAAGTSRAIQAIAAAGDDPQSARWTVAGGVNSIDALEALTPSYLSGGAGGRVGIIMQGVAAAGAPYEVADFAGLDLPDLMATHLQPHGAYDSTAFGIFAHSEAMLGLVTAGQPVAPQAIDLLQSAQVSGNWGEADANGIAIQVLGMLGKRVPVATLAVLHEDQLADGSWGFSGTFNPSAASEVVQGLTQIGQNPFGASWSRVVGGQLSNAADVVMSQQKANGCWPDPFGAGDDPYSTTDAIMLLATQPGWGVSLIHLPIVRAGN